MLKHMETLVEDVSALASDAMEKVEWWKIQACVGCEEHHCKVQMDDEECRYHYIMDSFDEIKEAVEHLWSVLGRYDFHTGRMDWKKKSVEKIAGDEYGGENL